jgi:hypothetical protein
MTIATVTENATRYFTGSVETGFVGWAGWGYVSGDTSSPQMGTEIPQSVEEFTIRGVHSCIPSDGTDSVDFIALAGEVVSFPSTLEWSDDRLTLNTTTLSGWTRNFNAAYDSTVWTSPGRPIGDANHYADNTDYNPTITVTTEDSGMATVETISSTAAAANGGTITLASGASAQVYAVPALGLRETVRLQQSHNGSTWVDVNDEDFDGIVLQESRNRAVLTGPGTFRVVKSATAVATVIYYDN